MMMISLLAHYGHGHARPKSGRRDEKVSKGTSLLNFSLFIYIYGDYFGFGFLRRGFNCAHKKNAHFAAGLLYVGA